jgi:hydrogenase nickel incorporation protein HypA/HybF
MHEFSICERLVNAVLEEVTALDEGTRVQRVHIVAGALHQIVPEYLATAYEALTGETSLAGSELCMEVRPVVGRCGSCAWEGEITPPFFQCAACEAFNIEMVSGKELFLDRLEIEEGGT